jgi:protein subunit release factor A
MSLIVEDHHLRVDISKTAGGWACNNAISVRMVHIPTGIVVTKEGREHDVSQLQLREEAKQEIIARVWAKQNGYRPLTVPTGHAVQGMTQLKTLRRSE